MDHQLVPLYVLAGVFGIYTALTAIREWLMYEDAFKEPADLITDITPQDTPFLRALKDANDE